MEKNKKYEPLSVGEKYLEIRIVGLNPIFVFRNKEYKDEEEALYIREGVKVFVRTKKAPQNYKSDESDLLW